PDPAPRGADCPRTADASSLVAAALAEDELLLVPQLVEEAADPGLFRHLAPARHQQVYEPLIVLDADELASDARRGRVGPCRHGGRVGHVVVVAQRRPHAGGLVAGVEEDRAPARPPGHELSLPLPRGQGALLLRRRYARGAAGDLLGPLGDRVRERG